VLLSELEELGHDVVPFGTVPRNLIIVGPLEDISAARVDELPHDLVVPTVGSQMQGSPLLGPSSEVDVKFFQLLLSELLVQSYYGLNPFFLAFPGCVVDWRPIVIVLKVGVGPIEDETVSDVDTLLGVL